MKIQIPNVKLPYNHSDADMKKWLSLNLKMSIEDIRDIDVLKRSVDARRKPSIYFVYTLCVSIKRKIDEKTTKALQITDYHLKEYNMPVVSSQKLDNLKEGNRPVIVGFGPSGLFSAYVLAKQGLKPIVIERGEDVENRIKTIRHFIKTGELDVNSNIQFGEGGAGTFSDGKLGTGVKDKFMRKQFILETFVEHGADPSVLYDNKPHVGSDYLVKVVKSMREAILNWGGEVRFNTTMTELNIENKKVTGINISTKAIDGTVTEGLLKAQQVILAIGHSSKETFRMLHAKSVPMDAKSFAIGLRIEHPQEFINHSQYGDVNDKKQLLPSADYKLTHQSENGRGVYTFCMCPGGYVINSASHKDMVVCNGMSLFGQKNRNANSAIIATVTPEDFEGQSALAGLDFQEKWERKAFELAGSDYSLPTQTYEGFYQSVLGKAYRYRMPADKVYQVYDVETTCESKTVEVDLKNCLPDEVSQALVEGIEVFGRRIQGFNHPKARLTGVETRTSSPVRIHRDERFMSEIQGLYPCGEGAGYAGGIMSSAIDGMKIAEEIIKN